MQILRVFSSIWLVVLVVQTLVYIFSAVEANILVNTQVTYQSINGWEASDTVGEVDYPAAFQTWREKALTRAVNELGINRVRLHTQAGVENPIDYFTQYWNGQIDRSAWRLHWHEAVNDNSDPGAIDTRGFQFSQIDLKIDQIVEPMRKLAAANGERLYVNLLYTAGSSGTGGPGVLHSDNPNEYAEFMLAHFLHIRDKYGWVPDQIEITNEPSSAKQWSPAKIGRAIVATAQLLRAHGFDPDFSAPSHINPEGAVTWFDNMISVVPGALDELTELAYHRYGGETLSNIQAIGSRVRRYGIRSAMLEKFDGGGTYLKLHEDLKEGLVSAWQQFAIAYPGNDSGAHYYWIDRANPSNPVTNMGSRTKFLRQYFKFIRAGAVRVEANSTNSALDPLAFVNPDGNPVLVIKADSAGSALITGLPAGTYAANYTTSSSYNVDAPAAAVSVGESLPVTIPAAGVLTVYRTSIVATRDEREFYFPQIAMGQAPGLNFSTEVLLLNGGAKESRSEISFLDDVGNPLPVTFNGIGTQEALTLNAPAFEGIALTTGQTGALAAGYARVRTTAGVHGTAVFARRDSNTGVLLYEAGVPATTPFRDFTLFLDSLGDKDTGVAFVNPPDGNAANLILRLYDTQFQQIANVRFSLAAGHHLARFIWEFFRDSPQVLQRTQEMRGVVTIESDRPVAAVTLRQHEHPSQAFPLAVPTLTTFPVVEGRAEQPAGGSDTSKTMFFPQVAAGIDGRLAFRSELILLNTGNTSNATIHFMDPTGLPLPFELDGRGTASSFRFTLGRGQPLSLVTSDTGPLKLGYARVDSSGGVAGTVVFTRSDATTGTILYEAGVPGPAPLKHFLLYLDSRQDRDTGLALVNTNQAATAHLTIRLHNLRFQPIGETHLGLGPAGHIARFMWELFEGRPDLAEESREMQGIVTVESDQPLSALTVRQNEDVSKPFPSGVPTLTTFPVAGVSTGAGFLVSASSEPEPDQLRWATFRKSWLHTRN